MQYTIFVQDSATSGWREVKRLEDRILGAVDVDRLAASGYYHAVELRQTEGGALPLHAWVQAGAELEHAA